MRSFAPVFSAHDHEALEHGAESSYSTTDSRSTRVENWENGGTSPYIVMTYMGYSGTRLLAESPKK